MNYKVLTKEQLQEAKDLKENKGYSKRQIVKHFLNAYGIQVGETTIWENLFHPERKRERVRTEYFRVYFSKPKNICNPCPCCSKCMTREIKDKYIPINFQVQDRCITCYLRTVNLTYMDLLNV